MTILRPFTICITSLTFLILTAFSTGTAQAQGNYSIYGHAYLAHDLPVVGAKVRLLNTKGKPLACFTSQPDVPCSYTTSEEGAFLFHADELPSHFYLEVSDGAVAGETLKIPLKSIVERSKLENGVDINIATTLIARYLKKHPRRGIKKAHNRVKNVLGLHENANLHWNLKNSPLHISGEKLLQHVKRIGGWQRWLRKLTQRMRKGQKKRSIDLSGKKNTRSSVHTRGIASIAGALAFSTIKSAASRCDAGSGKGLGWITASIAKSGLVSKNPSCETDKLIGEVKEQLDDIQHTLSELQVEMTDGFDELGVKITELNAINKDDRLTPYREKIDVAWKQLTTMRDSIPATLQPGASCIWTECDFNNNGLPDEIDRFLKKMEDLDEAEWGTINTLLMGDSGNGGYYKASWDAVRGRLPFVGQGDVDSFNAMVNYNAQYLVKLSLLMSERWHLGSTLPINLEDTLDSFSDDLDTQAGLILDDLPVRSESEEDDQISYYDPTTGYLWSRITSPDDNGFTQEEVVRTAKLIGYYQHDPETSEDKELLEGDIGGIKDVAGKWIFPDEHDLVGLVSNIPSKSHIPQQWLRSKMPKLFPRPTYTDDFKQHEKAIHIPYCNYFFHGHDTEEKRLARNCVLRKRREFRLKRRYFLNGTREYYPKFQKQCVGMSAYRLEVSEARDPFSKVWQTRPHKWRLFGYHKQDRFEHWFYFPIVHTSHTSTLRPFNQSNSNDLNCGSNWKMWTKYYGQSVVDTVPMVLIRREVLDAEKYNPYP